MGEKLFVTGLFGGLILLIIGCPVLIVADGPMVGFVGAAILYLTLLGAFVQIIIEAWRGK